MAKEIQISTDGGVTYLTLPGNTGELNREQATLDDTIFGSDFSSIQPGITSWTVSANGFYKGIPGYVATIKKSGTSTAATGESFTVDGGDAQLYHIDDTTKQVWDPSIDVVIFDNSVEVADADIDYLDYLFGSVRFADTYTPTGPITADLNYLPLSAFGKAQTFTLTQSADTEDVTTLDLAQANGGFTVFDYSQLSGELTTEGFWDTTNGIHDLITNRDLLVLELNPDGNADSVARGFFKVTTHGQSADAGATESESVTYSLFVPENPNTLNPRRPLSWQHAAGSTLSPVIQNVLNAWLTKAKVDVKYFPEDPSGDGYEGQAVISDVSLEGGIGNMNDFTVDLQGSGALTKLP